MKGEIIRIKKEELALSRTLNIWQVTFYGTGTILGAGIYALIGKIVGIAGVLTPISFILSALLAGMTAYSYSQLVKLYPRSGGEAEYVFKEFKSHPLSIMTGWLVALTGTISASTLLSGFVGYFQLFFDLPSLFIVSFMALLTLALTIKGIKESLNFIAVITIIEIIGLLLVCVLATPVLIEKNFLLSEIISNFQLAYMVPMMSGAFLAFFAFIGFEDIVNLAEETKAPGRTLSVAIIISIVVSTALYLYVSISAISVLDPMTLSKSKTPIADIYALLGGDPRLISVISLFAISNGILAQIIMASRVLYGIRHQSPKLKFLSSVNPITKTPIVSTLLVVVVTVTLSQSIKIEKLAGYTSFVILIVFTLVNGALLLHESRKIKKARMNIIMPAAATVLNILFLVFQMSAN